MKKNSRIASGSLITGNFNPSCCRVEGPSQLPGVAVLKLCLLLLMVSIPGWAVGETVSPPPNRYLAAQQEADKLYERGDYNDAFKEYSRLAKKGDIFSQYQLSRMYYAGQGTRQEWPEAYAWSVLAAQTGVQEFVDYREALTVLVPEDERKAALRRADYFTRRWGNVAIAAEARDRAKRELRTCTGSRLGTRCEDVYAQQMPNAWGINPGPGTGGSAAPRDADAGGSASGSGSLSSTAGGGGGDGRDIDHYQSLRQSIAALDAYIQRHTCRVELGEFEVLEPDSEGPEAGE